MSYKNAGTKHEKHTPNCCVINQQHVLMIKHKHNNSGIAKVSFCSTAAD